MVNKREGINKQNILIEVVADSRGSLKNCVREGGSGRRVNQERTHTMSSVSIAFQSLSVISFMQGISYETNTFVS